MKVCPVCSTEYPDEVKFCANDGSTLRASGPAASLIGQVIADRYHVVKKLGEGGMGQVYLAEHVKMGRRSAIKVMNPSMTHDTDAVARFNREAANASRITHPNVCAVYDFGETPDGMIYLAMEFIEGEPLTDVLEREGALPVPRAVEIFRQAADALQAAHDLGIVHRDLKPDNIMISRGREGGDWVKVVDFGIAKAVGGDEAGQKVTKTGLVVGTPEFMSPEQLSGDKVDGRSDLYSLALVFFRMLTGQLPFQADTVQETMIKRLTDEPTQLAQARPDLTFPQGLQQVLDTALARTPAQRYQSVAKFAADVRNVAGTRGGSPTSATPATRADVEAKTQILDSSATNVSPARSAPPATRASAGVPAKKRSLVPILVGAVLVLGGGGAGAAVLLRHSGAAPGTGSPADSNRTGTPVDSSKKAQPGQRTTHQQSAGLERPANATTPPIRPGGMDSAAASRMLDRFMADDTLPARILADSAPLIYAVTSLGTTDRAVAACMTAQAHQVLHNAQLAVSWAQKGLALNSTLNSCKSVLTNGGQ